MKTQSINLYNKVIDQTEKNAMPNWHQFIILNILFIVIIFLIYSYQAVNLYLLKIKVNKLTDTVKLLENTFYQKKQQYPDLFFSKDPEKTVNIQGKELAVQRKLLDNISNHDELTNYLSGFSKLISQNTWINEINISSGGNLIKLSGQSINYAPMNRFFENIINDSDFNKYTLNIDEISKEKENIKHLIHFKVNLKKAQ